MQQKKLTGEPMHDGHILVEVIRAGSTLSDEPDDYSIDVITGIVACLLLRFDEKERKAAGHDLIRMALEMIQDGLKRQAFEKVIEQAMEAQRDE